ncbi:MAG: hypothetical protein ABSC13_07855 [Dehalococcoidia bacterium]|jgi:hypothetical protein
MTSRRPRPLTADEVVARTRKRWGTLEREDLLLVSISLVKGGRCHAEPADFVSDVALTFRSLEGRTRRSGNFKRLPTTAASTISASESGQPDARTLDWLAAG